MLMAIKIIVIDSLIAPRVFTYLAIAVLNFVHTESEHFEFIELWDDVNADEYD